MVTHIQQCKGPQDCHVKNHLCQIILRKDLGRIRALVKEARFYCMNCGRAAHESENLCNPSRIE